MRVRALDADKDWTYGQSQNNYRTQLAAVIQNVDTRLSSFLGNCFYDLGAGIDWFLFLGGKDQLSLQLAISAVILNTQFITGITSVEFSLNRVTRKFSITYKATSSFGPVTGGFILPTHYITTEDGSPITTEDISFPFIDCRNFWRVSFPDSFKYF